MNRVWTLVVLLAVLSHGIYACPDQIKPENAIIETSDNSSITYACKPLYELTSGDLERNCSENGSWTGQPPVCSLMNCTDFKNSSTMLVDTFTAQYGNSIQVNCLTGYAVSVSNSSDPPTVVTTQTVRCTGDPSQNLVYWEEANDCSVITCAEPPVRQNSFNIDTGNRKYKSTIRYSCESGYSFYSTPHIDYTCSLNATWEGYGWCSKSNEYIGCYEEGVVYVTFQTTKDNVQDCIKECRKQDSRYAAMAASQCQCANYRNSTYDLQVNSLCNTPCNDQQKEFYCGGPDGRLSLYITRVSGCYLTMTDSVSDLQPFNVSGNKAATCIEYCRGAGAYFSIFLYSNEECVCTNRSSLVTNLDGQQCDLFEEHQHNFTNLVMQGVEYKSCEELYDTGIRQRGYYYINQTKILCNFKDGTVCDDGWIGYKGACYYFHVTNMTFAEAAHYCNAHNATVVSLMSSQEHSFVSEAVRLFPDFKTNGNGWHIGLNNYQSVSVFSWSDGNILTKQFFEESEPSDESRQCVALSNGKWYSHDCANATNVICKHNKENLLCMQTMDVVESSWNSSKDDMSLTICTQACIARGYLYAINRADECHCVDTLPLHTRLSFDKCNRGCPGNTYQLCGGSQNGTYTASKVTNINKASTCEELQSQGLEGDMYKLQHSVSATFCENTGCPFSWIRGNSSCYKFMVGKKIQAAAVEYCANSSSYLAVFENAKEEEFISKTTNNIGIYNGITTWKFGLFSPAQYSSLFGWANGYPYKDIDQNIATGTSKVVGSLVSSTWTLSSVKDSSSFICEKGPDYLGCFKYPGGLFVAVNLTNSVKSMTIEKCLELCRGSSYNISLIKEDMCFCTNSVATMIPYPSGCSKSTCSYTQPCGSVVNNAVSAFANAYYPMYDNCFSLFRQGITVNGFYRLKDGIEWCNFADNTSCPDGWIGYKEKCYQFVLKKQSFDDNIEACRHIEGTPVAIRDDDEHAFLKICISAEREYTKHSLEIGLSDEFLVGVPTWSTGIIASFTPQPVSNTQELGYALISYMTPRYSLHSKDYASHAVICQLDFAHKGCFVKPTSIAPALTSNSMELTQCKQICLGKSNGTGYVIIQETECFCTDNIDTLVNVSVSYCTSNCPGSRQQRCGGPDYVSVYSYDESDIATSCSMLAIHRVWYNSTYLIKENGTTVKKQCGIFDGDTLCNVGWYGKHGYCYRIYPGVRQFDKANANCLKENGYLFYISTSSVHKNGILSLLMNVERHSQLSNWWISVLDVFMNGMYLEGDGHVVSSTDWEGNTTITDMYSTVSSHSGLWTATNKGSFPYLCEKSPGYLGCKKNFTTASPFTSISNISWMTATQCIQYCLGQGSVYAAVTELQTCLCLQETNFTSGYESDCESCPGYESQPCGSKSGHISVFILEEYSSEIFADCSALEQVGVIQPGIYTIQSSSSTSEKVQCFARGPSVDVIPVSSSQYSASSEDDVYKASKAPITLPFGPNDVWIPLTTDKDPWLQIDLVEEYVVVGISTQGRPSHDHMQWISNYRIKFMSLITSQWTDSGYKLGGNSDRTTLATEFFSKPFLTKQMRIYPEYSTQMALRVRTYGQRLTNVNHTDSTLGCYLYDPKYFESTSVPQNEDDCLSYCYKSEKAFFAFDSNGSVCYCLRNPDILGKLEDCSSSNSRIIKRTFDMSCPVPQPAGNSTNTSYYAHTNGVYTVKSTIQYNCLEGYEYRSGKTSNTITCIDGNLWSANISDCQIVNCPAVNASDHAVLDTSDTEFGTVVTATCDVGYTLADNSTEQVAICRADKTWNITMQDCQEISCGTPPSVTDAVQSGNNYTYDNIVTYTCKEKMWFSNNTFSKRIRCNLNGSWDVISEKCSYYMCSDPPVMHNTIATRLTATSAKYTCRQHFKFDDKSRTKIVNCNLQHNTWDTLNNTCVIDETLINRKMGHFSNHGKYLITDSNGKMIRAMTEMATTSFIECADYCIRETYCVALNYFSSTSSESYNCRIYDKALTSGTTLTADSKWKYFKVDDLDFV